MSIEMMVRALDVQDLPPAEKLVLIGIANHADVNGENAWPSVATLARYASVSERQARRLVHSLETKGFLTIEVNAGGTKKTRDDQRPNLYSINGGTLVSSREVLRPDIQRADGGTPSAQRADIAMSAEPSLNLPLEPSTLAHPSERTCFDQFWQVWPKRKSRGTAEVAFKRQMKTHQLVDILDGARLVADRWDAMPAERKFIPHPATWLNAKGWLDEVDLPAQQPEVALVEAMTPWFERRFNPAQFAAARPRLIECVRTLRLWGYSDGEIAVRIAIAARYGDREAFVTARQVANVAAPRFGNAPTMHGTDTTLDDAMERAFSNQRWTQ